MKITSQIIGEYKGEDKQEWDKRIIDNLKSQIAEEQPRCRKCGQFFGVDDVLNDRVESKIIVDTHFTREQQWYEHKDC